MTTTQAPPRAAVAQKTVFVRYLGFQEAPADMEGCHLYNIVSFTGGTDLCVGSTVTLQSMHSKGYFVEIVEDVEQELTERTEEGI